MNCPRCDYHSRFTEIACPRCNSKFGLADVEELTHVRYVVSRLERWMGDGLLPGATAEGALREARADIALLERKLGLTITERKPVQLEHASRVPTKTTEDEAFDAFLAGASRRAVTPTPRTATRETTNSSLMDMEPPTTMVVPIPKQAPALLKTPRPQRPTFTWAQVGAYLLSERTLNALLALGAFLILASVLVISTVNPTNLAPIPHVLALVVATLTFFAFGSFVRQRLALTRTGAALLAIAADSCHLTSGHLVNKVFWIGKPAQSGLSLRSCARRCISWRTWCSATGCLGCSRQSPGAARSCRSARGLGYRWSGDTAC